MKTLAAQAPTLPALQTLLGDDAQGLTQGVFDLLPVGVYVCDSEGRVVDYNRAAADLWGHAPERGSPAVRFCGSYRLYTLDGSAVPHDRCPMAAVLAGGSPRRDEEIVIERHDGTRLTALVSIEPIKDAEGRVLGAVNVFRDNTAQHRKDETLRRQSHQLDTLLQALPAAVYTTDAEGRITFFNEAAAALWGVRPELGSDRFCGSWKLYRPDGTPLPHDECPMAMALKSRTRIRGKQAVAERPDGSRVPFLAYPTPLFDAAGNLTGAINVLLDIAERHEMDERLRSSEQRYRSIFDNAQVSFWEVDFSQVLDFLDTLRAAGVSDLRAHLAAHPEVLRGAIGRLRIAGVNRFTRALFEARDDEPLPRLLAGIRAPETDSMLLEWLVALWEGRPRFEGESALRTMNGRRLHVLVSIAFAGDRAERAIASVHDITERRRTALAAQRLAAIVESSDDAILSKDINGIITSWNFGAERLFGYTAEEAVGQPVTMLIPADRHDEEDMILARIRSGERVDHFETLRQRKDGGLIPISLTISPIRTADGTIIGASKIARDITDNVVAREQQQLLLREMNHRIKNLLTLSSGLVSLSARYAETPAELATAVQERLQALARAQEIILPDTAADALGEVDRGTTLRALIATVISPFENPLHNAPSRIEIRGADVAISGRAATGFALLVHEFATNAAKYGALSTEEGRIAIDCSEQDGVFVLLWQERGGPPVNLDGDGPNRGGPNRDGPNRDAGGFGDVLTRATVQGQLRGEITKDWGAEGLTIRLSAPKERLLM